MREIGIEILGYMGAKGSISALAFSVALKTINWPIHFRRILSTCLIIEALSFHTLSVKTALSAPQPVVPHEEMPVFLLSRNNSCNRAGHSSRLVEGTRLNARGQK